MTELEELSLENCNLSSHDITNIASTIKESGFVNQLKRVNFNLNKNAFVTVQSCTAMAEAVAKCPRFEEFKSEKTGIRLTINHRVKVRRT